MKEEKYEHISHIITYVYEYLYMFMYKCIINIYNLLYNIGLSVKFVLILKENWNAENFNLINILKFKF